MRFVAYRIGFMSPDVFARDSSVAENAERNPDYGITEEQEITAIFADAADARDENGGES